MAESEYFADHVHHVPGRLRLKLSAIKRNDARARLAEQQLCVLDGVRSAIGNSLTGSLVVRFDPQFVSAERIFAELKACGLLEARAIPYVTAPAATMPQIGGIARAMPSRSLADALVDKTIEALVERCAIALVAALI
ncbi:HMA2 domain-containing protein [Trinickia sp. EG282A]|uniref:HMA2 domain-containing protein n=1 Tax=Trinickia sp. EG282A TaxID=3237013 RepID=UPI0034D198EC